MQDIFGNREAIVMLQQSIQSHKTPLTWHLLHSSYSEPLPPRDTRRIIQSICCKVDASFASLWLHQSAGSAKKTLDQLQSIKCGSAARQTRFAWADTSWSTILTWWHLLVVLKGLSTTRMSSESWVNQLIDVDNGAHVCSCSSNFLKCEGAEICVPAVLKLLSYLIKALFLPLY